MSRLEILVAVVTAIAFVVLLWDTHKRRVMSAWDKGYRRGHSDGWKPPDCELEFVMPDLTGPMIIWPPVKEIAIPFVDEESAGAELIDDDMPISVKKVEFGQKCYRLKKVTAIYEPTG